jgi:predicted lipid carrier protein YhbT
VGDLLARRLEDPDTLFFSLRLSMEGDTELGLLVKNTLDAIDAPLVTLEQFKPSRAFASLKSRLIPG